MVLSKTTLRSIKIHSGYEEFCTDITVNEFENEKQHLVCGSFGACIIDQEPLWRHNSHTVSYRKLKHVINTILNVSIVCIVFKFLFLFWTSTSEIGSAYAMHCNRTVTENYQMMETFWIYFVYDIGSSCSCFGYAESSVLHTFDIDQLIYRQLNMYAIHINIITRKKAIHRSQLHTLSLWQISS